SAANCIETLDVCAWRRLAPDRSGLRRNCPNHRCQSTHRQRHARPARRIPAVVPISEETDLRSLIAASFSGCNGYKPVDQLLSRERREDQGRHSLHRGGSALGGRRLWFICPSCWRPMCQVLFACRRLCVGAAAVCGTALKQIKIESCGISALASNSA